MILTILGGSKIMFLILGVLLALGALFLTYHFVRERRRDQEEIEEIVANLVEARPRTEEVKEVEAVEKKSNIEEVLAKMQEDLSVKAEDVVATFEQEQEEKSIISYQELLNTRNQPIEVEPQKKVTEKTKQKFRNTDFISPVYGKLEEHLEYPTVPAEQKEQVHFDFSPSTQAFESTLEELKEKEKSLHHYLSDFKGSMEIDHLENVIAPVSQELKKNDEFLEALKEFRKNLD